MDADEGLESPSVRDVLIVVKDGDIALLSGHGVQPDPVGPLIARLAQRQALGDPETASYKSVLLRNHSSSLLSFQWKKSGALIIRSHILVPQSGHDFDKSLLLSTLNARCFDVPQAEALLHAGISNTDKNINQFLDATLPLLQPVNGPTWDVVAHDTRAQSPCMFCFARGIIVCDCPTPMRRRRCNPMSHETLKPSSLCLYNNRYRNDDTGTVFVTFLLRLPVPVDGGPRPRPIAMFSRASRIRTIMDTKMGVCPTIQYLLGLSGKLRGLDNSNNNNKYLLMDTKPNRNTTRTFCTSCGCQFPCLCAGNNISDNLVSSSLY